MRSSLYLNSYTYFALNLSPVTSLSSPCDPYKHSCFVKKDSGGKEAALHLGSKMGKEEVILNEFSASFSSLYCALVHSLGLGTWNLYTHAASQAGKGWAWSMY